MASQNLSYKRYQRQLILNEFGGEGQQKLSEASVLVVGAGGLGCPALQYLTAGGVGRIGIIDDDRIALHNLHRQILYTTDDIGLLKAEVAEKRLRCMNPEVQFRIYPVRLDNKNALGIITDYHFVVDATDNFATRYIVNDACVLLDKPLIYGAISMFEGQVAIFNVAEAGQRVNYRHLFPKAPEPGSVLNCAEAGVMGVLPGIIGTMQAAETIKLIIGIGKPLVNQLLTYNLLRNESVVFDLTANADTELGLPKNWKEFEELDYGWFCEGRTESVYEIDVHEFNSVLDKTATVIIDVREEGERPRITEFPHLNIPLSRLKADIPAIEHDTVIVFCQTGKRSAEAAKILSSTFGSTKKILSLKGGITNWKLNGKEA